MSSKKNIFLEKKINLLLFERNKKKKFFLLQLKRMQLFQHHINDPDKGDARKHTLKVLS